MYVTAWLVFAVKCASQYVLHLVSHGTIRAINNSSLYSIVLLLWPSNTFLILKTVVCAIHCVSKKCHTWYYPYLCRLLTDFQNFFTGTLSIQLSIKRILSLCRYTTLWNINSKKS